MMRKFSLSVLALGAGLLLSGFTPQESEAALAQCRAGADARPAGDTKAAEFIDACMQAKGFVLTVKPTPECPYTDESVAEIWEDCPRRPRVWE